MRVSDSVGCAWTARARSLAVALISTAFPAYSQPLEPFGKIELSGGAEKEAHAEAGGRFTMEGLGVLPLVGDFGAQAAMHVVGGLGARVGFNAAPVFAFPGGKVGAFVSYQHRGLRSTNFVHIIPAVAFYLPQININAWYSHPVNGGQRSSSVVEYGINRLQGTVSLFAGSDWWAPLLRRDNVELLAGVQVNTFAGPGHNKLGGTGVGPVPASWLRPWAARAGLEFGVSAWSNAAPLIAFLVN